MSDERGFLVLDELTKRFPGQHGQEVVAVDQVSLGLPRGALLTLLGPSGCGKTTTLRLVAGFEQPTDGRIYLDGRDITDVPANRRGMAMVFQSYAIFPHLNVFENVAYGLRVRKLPHADVRRQVRDALELVGLLGLENRQPNRLSGGQQQRVALARALVMKPALLLFDEPLSNLDARLRLQMREQIRQLQQELGITAVYVTHDQAEAMALSDVIAVMHRGRIEQAGGPAEIYRRPRTAFVADFIGKANFVPARLLGRENGLVVVEALGTTVQVEPPALDDLGERVTLVVRPDAVLIGPPGSGVPGRVVRSTFLGSTSTYDLEVAGQRIEAVRHDPSGAPPVSGGSEIGVRLLAECATLLPETVGEA